MIRTSNVIISITNLFLISLGIILYSFTLDLVVTQFIYLLGVSLCSVILVKTSNNIILFSRITLLFLVGAYPLGVKLLDESYFFSVFEFGTQSLDITIVMFSLMLISIPGAYLGWVFGAKCTDTPNIKKQHYNRNELRGFFYFTAIAAVVSGYMLTLNSTGTIFLASYGSGVEGTPFFGTISTIGGTALSIMFYSALVLKNKNYMKATILVSIYLLIYCQLLRGLRQDIIGTLFSMFVIYLLQSKGKININMKLIFLTIPMVIFMEAWGLVRTGMHMWLNDQADFSDVINQGLGNAAVMDNVIYSGTLGPISTTLANTIYLLKNETIDFIYGNSYIDYILRTPPEFLYPDRPKDYATMFSNFNLSAGGGFFELAEAYLNFGIIGAFIVPFVLSLVISIIYLNAKRNNGIFAIFALSSILCIWIRGAWYQTFAYYKSFISATILFLAIKCILVLYRMIKLTLKKNYIQQCRS